MAADEGTRASARARRKILSPHPRFGSQAGSRHHRALLQAGRLLLRTRRRRLRQHQRGWCDATAQRLASTGDRGRAVAPASPRRRAGVSAPPRAAALARASPAREARRYKAASLKSCRASQADDAARARMFFGGAYRLRVLKQRIRDMGRSAASPRTRRSATCSSVLTTAPTISLRSSATRQRRAAQRRRAARAREPSAAPSATPESRGDAERIVRELGGTVLRLYVDGLAQSVDEQPEPSRAGAGSALQNLATATRSLASAKKHTRAFFEASRLFAFVDADGSGPRPRRAGRNVPNRARAVPRAGHRRARAAVERTRSQPLHFARSGEEPSRSAEARGSGARGETRGGEGEHIARWLHRVVLLRRGCVAGGAATGAYPRADSVRKLDTARAPPRGRSGRQGAGGPVHRPCAARARSAQVGSACAAMHRRVWTLTDEDGSGYLDVEEYVHLWANLKRVVSSGGETRRRAAEAEAADDRRAALKEWEFDAQGADHLNYSRFALSFFQIADAWTDKVSPMLTEPSSSGC